MARMPKRLPSPAALQRTGGKDLALLAEMLATARPGDSVHGARRRIKRLRSLLRLIRGPLGEENFQRLNASLRQAADSLAGSRRAEALLIAARRIEPARARPALWRALALAHRQAHEAGGSPEAGLETAREALAEATRDLAQVRLTDARGAEVAAATIAAYAKARRKLRRALASGDPDQLHEARKFVIHHLHHRSILGLGGKRRSARLEDLRQSLGDLNDLDELAQLAAANPVPPSPRAMTRLQKERARLLTAVAAHAEQLFRHGPKAYGKRLGLTVDVVQPDRVLL